MTEEETRITSKILLLLKSTKILNFKKVLLCTNHSILSLQNLNMKLILYIAFSLPLLMVNAFKHHFEYFDQVFINSTQWVIQLTYNYSIMEEHANELNNVCENIPTKLIELKDGIKIANVPQLTDRYIRLPTALPYPKAKTQCRSLGNTCKLASMKSKESKSELLKFMQEQSLFSAHLNYDTRHGNIYNENDLIENFDYLFRQNISIKACPSAYFMNEYKADIVDCFKFTPNNPKNLGGFYYTYAEKMCQEDFDGTLFMINTTRDVSRAYQNVNDEHKTFWLGGAYTEHSNPQVPVCGKSSKIGGINAHMVYDRSDNCVFFDKNTAIHGALCYRNGLLKNMNPRSINFKNIIKNLFAYNQGSLSIYRNGEFYLQTANTRLPTVCECEVPTDYNEIQQNYRTILIDKISAAIQHINIACDNTLNPIKESPYITTEEGDAIKQFEIPSSKNVTNGHRQKRSIVSLITSALRSSVGIFGKAFSRVKPISNMAIGTSTRSTKFLPSMKQMAYLSTIASAAGITGLTIDEFVNRKKRDVNENFNAYENMYDSVQQFNNLKYDRTDSSQDIQISLLQDHVLGLDNAFKSTISMNMIDTSVDQILLAFKSLTNLVSNHFKAYNKMIDALTSRLFNDPIVSEGILKAAEQIPTHYGFLSENIFEVIESATVSHNVNNTHVTVNLHLPVADERVLLYLFKATPLPYDTAMGPVIPKYESPYIAVTKNRKYYALVHPRDLITCAYKNYFLCPSLPIFNKDVQTCIYAHFVNNHVRASHCNFYELKDKNIFTLTNDHQLHYFVKEETLATISCVNKQELLDDTYTISLAKGTGNLTIPASCVVEVNGFLGLNPQLSQSLVPAFEFAQSVDKATSNLMTLPRDTFDDDGFFVPTSIYSDSATLMYVIKPFMDIFISIIVVIVLVVLSCCCCAACKYREKLKNIKQICQRMCLKSDSYHTNEEDKTKRIDITDSLVERSNHYTSLSSPTAPNINDSFINPFPLKTSTPMNSPILKGSGINESRNQHTAPINRRTPSLSSLPQFKSGIPASSLNSTAVSSFQFGSMSCLPAQQTAGLIFPRNANSSQSGLTQINEDLMNYTFDDKINQFVRRSQMNVNENVSEVKSLKDKLILSSLENDKKEELTSKDRARQDNNVTRPEINVNRPDYNVRNPDLSKNLPDQNVTIIPLYPEENNSYLEKQGMEDNMHLTF